MTSGGPTEFQEGEENDDKGIASQVSVLIRAVVKHPAEQRWPSEDTFNMQIKTEESEGWGFQLEEGAAARNLSFPRNHEFN